VDVVEVIRLYYGSIAGPLGPATPFNGYAIKHPDGVIVVDTGFGPTLGGEGFAGELVRGEKRYPWVRRSTSDALADHGLEVGDVKYIINTHLGDHSGDNDMFPEATFIIQEPEAVDRRKLGKSHPRVRTWDFPGAKLELLGGEDASIMPGVKCLFTPGHTAGHQSVLIDDGDTSTLFVGDALYTSDIWDDPDQIQLGHAAFKMQVGNPDALGVWQESATKLKQLNVDVLHFAHDSGIVHHRHSHG
jgi:N-acyl homoserine lactone hydrolase